MRRLIVGILRLTVPKAAGVVEEKRSLRSNQLIHTTPPMLVAPDDKNTKCIYCDSCLATQ